MKNSKALKQIASVFEHYIEYLIVLFGLLSILVVFVVPLRLDIRLLVGGFGLFLVATGSLAKLICRKV